MFKILSDFLSWLKRWTVFASTVTADLDHIEAKIERLEQEVSRIEGAVDEIIVIAHHLEERRFLTENGRDVEKK